jgi:chromosome segregation ATPase
MRGFKSFGNKKVSLPLAHGLTAIVGPNGSGKSNVVEAFSFVLGQLSAKTMRAERFSDLIFYGGNGRRPSPFAEVSLHFDNSDNALPVDSETIEISRRVSRNGKCVYRINKKRAPREKVVNLLSRAVMNPEGHNFVMQGDVDKLIKLSPLERRLIIDDLAGVAEFDEKKSKAISELEKVENNLRGAHAALVEIERQMQKLSAERDDALRYKELKDELEDTRGSLLYLRRSAHQRRLTGLKSKLEETEQQLQKFQANREKLDDKKEEREKEFEKLNKLIQRKENTEVIASVEKLRERARTLKEMITSAETSYVNTETRIKELQKKIEKTSKEAGRETDLKKIVELTNKFSHLRQKFSTLTKNLNKERLSRKKTEQTLSEMKRVLNQLHTIINSISKLLTDALRKHKKHPQSAGEARERELIGSRLQLLQSQHDKLCGQHSELERRLRELKQNLQETKKSLKIASENKKKIRKSTQSARKERSKLERRIKRLDRRISQLDDKIQPIKTQRENYRIKEAGWKAELKTIEKEWNQVKNKVRSKPKMSAAKLEDKIERTESEIERLEPINMRAVESYKDTKRHYEARKKRYDKLVEEKQTLLDFMYEIDRKKTKVFMRTFNEISGNFSEIFSGLSPGGTARLALENPEDPLEGGLEIEAKPAGKELLRTNSMSGGEKALTALAFIFALQRARPTAFYVLDEIDAHLDPENLQRVAKMLQRSSKQSQIVVITLRDAMMSVADRLLGVSMDETNESHIVSVELAGLA